MAKDLPVSFEGSSPLLFRTIPKRMGLALKMENIEGLKANPRGFKRKSLLKA